MEIKSADNFIKLAKFGFTVAVCAIVVPCAALAAWVSQLDSGTVQAWAVVVTLLLPVVGAGAWFARGALATAERRGLDTGMAHTLDLVRAVRPAQSPSLPATTITQAALPYIPVDFQMLSQDARVIEL